MGEKEGGKGGDGEKKKPEAAQGEKKKDDGGKSKKEDGPINVVLKVDMHCEGCARKVRSAVKGIEGVESVSTDCASNKLTVVGKVEPWQVRDRVESKVHKAVVLVSPNVPRKEEKPKEAKKDDKAEKKADEKKPTVPTVSTVVLKVCLHCEGCIQRIRRIITKVKGVDAVTIDKEKEEVTVKGTMDAKALPEYLSQKFKRPVTVVAPKKADGGGDKKAGGGGGGGDKKGKEEKKGDKEEGGGGEKKKEGGGAAKAPETNKMEYHGMGGFAGGFSASAPPPYAYFAEQHMHAPQYFSDENPNACSVM